MDTPQGLVENLTGISETLKLLIWSKRVWIIIFPFFHLWKSFYFSLN